MSKNLPGPETTDEVDIGHIFSQLEKLFKKIGELISKLFAFLFFIIKKIGVLFLLFLNILKKHFIKIGIAGALTYALFTVLDRTSEPVYQSNFLINQNFETGKLLYNTIFRFNALAEAGDSISLSKKLKISPSMATKLVGFEIMDNANENMILESYYKYIKSVDSTLIISFPSYKENYNLENISSQTISVFSLDPNVYENLAEAIINNIESNKYFIEKKREHQELIKNRIKAYNSMLSKSDVLQEEYIQLLKNYYGQVESEDPGKTTLNLNLSGNKDKIDTKEFDLFKEQNSIKMELTRLQNELEQKETVVSIQNDFPPAIQLVSSYGKNKLWATILVSGLVFLFFLFKEFNFMSIIKEYGNTETLLKN